MSDKCELCEWSKMRMYADNPKWAICKCRICHKPIAVYKEHGVVPSAEELTRVKKHIEGWIFGKRVTAIAYDHAQIYSSDHYHFHILLGEKVDGS